MMSDLHAVWKILHTKYYVFVFIVIALLVQFLTGYFKGLVPAIREIRWKKVFFCVLGAAAVLPFLVLIDPYAAPLAKDAPGLISRMTWRYGSEWGKSIWIFLAFSYAAVIWNRKWRNVVFSAAFASMLSGLTAAAFKYTVLRARPDSGHGPWAFFNFREFLSDNSAFQSFPSGDVCLAAAACFFWGIFLRKKNAALSFVFFITPLMTAFSRMYPGRHWLSDVSASLAIGMAWAFFAFSCWRKSLERSGTPAQAS